jgi:hypothetical protein
MMILAILSKNTTEVGQCVLILRSRIMFMRLQLLIRVKILTRLRFRRVILRWLRIRWLRLLPYYKASQLLQNEYELEIELVADFERLHLLCCNSI